MTSRTTADIDAVIAFLLAVRKRGPFTLTAIHPDRVIGGKKDENFDPHVQRMPTATFFPKTFKAMGEWIEYWNKTHNIYFQANPSCRHAYTRRAREKIHPLDYRLDL